MRPCALAESTLGIIPCAITFHVAGRDSSALQTYACPLFADRVEYRYGGEGVNSGPRGGESLSTPAGRLRRIRGAPQMGVGIRVIDH